MRALAAALLIAGCLLGATPGTATAQQRGTSIIVASLLRIEPASRAPFPIQIEPLDAVPSTSFIRLRGLPATAALSDGHSIAPGAWAVPLASLPRLQILLPGGAGGQSEISIALVSADGAVLAEARTTLLVAPPPPTAASAAMVLRGVPPPSPQQEPPTETPPPRQGAEARERALRLVKKGDEQLAEGGVAQARLLYERAAEAGLAQGAMAMAATYDSLELQRLGVRGLKADPDAARRWYERARELGAPEAAARLRRLGAN